MTFLNNSEDATRYPFYSSINDTQNVIKIHLSYSDKLKNIDSLYISGPITSPTRILK
ncbi:protein of unknown function [Chryseobacterium sp. JV274]|nr:protein of unknown function [Chryseobacterium sp. JV274]